MRGWLRRGGRGCGVQQRANSEVCLSCATLRHLAAACNTGTPGHTTKPRAVHMHALPARHLNGVVAAHPCFTVCHTHNPPDPARTPSQVVEAAPGFKRVEVEQVGELRVMWVCRSFKTYLDVTEDARDPECLRTEFSLLRSVSCPDP